jgi:hypothetical protein
MRFAKIFFVAKSGLSVRMMLLVLVKTAQTSAPRAAQITIWLRILRGNNQESLNASLP